MSYSGSLGGLIALAEGKADLAGSHLWDEESDTYNEPFVRRLLPGRRVALLTLAHRRLGPDRCPRQPPPAGGARRPGAAGSRFINRQRARARASGWTRSCAGRQWTREAIAGYDHEVNTHAEVARAVAEGAADAGPGHRGRGDRLRAGLRPPGDRAVRPGHPGEAWETAGRCRRWPPG